jgi:hypothetical protein
MRILIAWNSLCAAVTSGGVLIVAVICATSVKAQGPAAPTRGDSPTRGHALSGKELRALFIHGAELREDYTNSVRSHEIFSADGTYQGCGDRAFLSASFEIRDSRLCVIDKAGAICRIIIHRTAGAYWQRFFAKDGHLLGPLSVSIAPGAMAKNCLSPESSR